jgi:hypothetical protein
MYRLYRCLHIRFQIRAMAIAFLVLILFGCATRGIQEFMLYRNAFSATHSAAQTILDQLAVSERALFHEARSGETILNFEFDPSEARYYIETMDPPITASLRQSFDIVNAYSEAMAALVSGESAEMMAARVSEIGALAMDASVTLAGLTGAGVLSPVSDVALEIVNPLRSFAPLAEFAFTQRTRKEYQDRLLADYDNIDAALARMRDLSPAMFDAMKTNLFLSSRSAGGAIPDSEVFNKMVALRALMANWVILIEHSRVALDQARQAVASNDISGSIKGLTTTASELDEVAKNVRRILAIIRQ